MCVRVCVCESIPRRGERERERERASFRMGVTTVEPLERGGGGGGGRGGIIIIRIKDQQGENKQIRH